MGKLKHWLQDKLFTLRTGIPVHTANGGEPIDVITMGKHNIVISPLAPNQRPEKNGWKL